MLLLSRRLVSLPNGTESPFNRFPARSLLLLVLASFFAPASWAQISATLSGTVTDQSGASVPGADISVRNVETGTARNATTNGSGLYELFALPVGEYEIHAKKEGFAEQVQTGIRLVVGQNATVDMRLQVGTISKRIDVDADTALVSTTTADTTGLVGEQQVKDLPLNGRSYDLLAELNPAVVNFAAEKTGGTGISNSSTANNFVFSGNRPEQNLVLLNGIEYTGAAENNMTPGGPSGQLLGVEAVREFNALRDSYGAEYGKHPGGQVSIVTQSGTNEWHGSAYEYLRNNALDARNFFDVAGAPLFERNQFGGALGGPISKNKTFLFANYEGFRQNLHQTSVTFVPANDARTGTAPFPALGSGCTPAQQAQCAAIVSQLMTLWPVANGPELTIPNGTPTPTPSGVAALTSSPLQTIREDFGTTRFDHIFSEKDTFSAVYTIDDGINVDATVFNPYSSDITTLREQVLSLEETHFFSPNFLNTARFGYSRAGYFFTGLPTPGTPAADVTSFVTGHPSGAVVVGGSTASNPATQLGLAGSNNGSDLTVARNIFTYQDQIILTHGKHQWSAGLWFQQFQSNETIALSQFGQLSFPSVTALVRGGGPGSNVTFLYDPSPTKMNWRSFFGAWFVEDVIRLTPRLTLSLGFRDEFSTGWNEAHNRAANYFFTNGVINTDPHVGHSVFSVNNFTFLPQPRVALAWSPFGSKTVIRAAFGMYNDLQDALGYRMDQNAPFNPTYSIANFAVSNLPLPISPIPASAKLIPGGVQPNMKAPTLISYSLRVQRALSQNTALTVAYVGSHGYHEILGLDANTPIPTICPAAPCPAVYPAGFGALSGTPVPAGSFFIPVNAPLANPSPVIANTWTWFSLGTASYNALQLDLNHRFSDGLSLRGVYTWSKALDDGDSMNGTLAQNAPGLVANPFDIRADWGPATYDVQNAASISALYELPFGRGKRFSNGLGGWNNQLASGWSVASIVTLQSGFPFTPQLSYNPSNNKDNRNPVRPFVNPAFAGPKIIGTPAEWFDPTAMIAPPNNSGFYGNMRRDSLIGPGLATWDFSVLKDTAIRERLRLQFRAELFNILNRANFNTPNLIIATLQGTTPVPNPAAGTITSTATSARQVQFALKLLW